MPNARSIVEAYALHESGIRLAKKHKDKLMSGVPFDPALLQTIEKMAIIDNAQQNLRRVTWGQEELPQEPWFEELQNHLAS